MFPTLQQFCDTLTASFESIPEERKELLSKISSYIQQKKDSGEKTQLVYVCTHNSRRSLFGQVWAAVAATYYNISNVSTFSGGTEATAFNINAINSLKRTGFVISDDGQSVNPKHTVQYGDNLNTVCFSKVYNDAANPQNHFAAIMTCSDAEQNCPFIPGVELRIGTTYNDPKAADNTPEQDTTYDERSMQIALESLYVFSLVK
ncbi:MAG: protein-tyrosine-phosphatase [Bacteroidota bacterium]